MVKNSRNKGTLNTQDETDNSVGRSYHPYPQEEKTWEDTLVFYAKTYPRLTVLGAMALALVPLAFVYFCTEVLFPWLGGW